MLLKELRLKANHLSVLHNFYKEVLELPKVYSNENSLTIIAGTSKIIFEKTNEVENPFYHFAFNIPSNKFEEAFQWMKNRVELLWLDDYKSYIADFVNWNAKSFYFIDPGGNILEFIAISGLKDNVDGKFIPSHIRNISEIGLVFAVDSFDKDVDNFIKIFPIPYFDKQPPLPHFRVIGNNEGLFIVVPENRIWFSTKNKRSQIFPMQITFMENDKLHELMM